MAEKVFLTRSQKECYDELEAAAAGFASDIVREYFERAQDGLTPVHSISIDDIVAIAYNLKEIEIKGTFAAGELVAVKWTEEAEEVHYRVKKQAARAHTGFYFVEDITKEESDNSSRSVHVSMMRHVTKAEEIWIGDLKRDFVGQLKIDDLVENSTGEFIKLKSGTKIFNVNNAFGARGFYPASSYIDLRGLHYEPSIDYKV